MNFNKKIAYITSRFPPLRAETYNVREVQALECMGLDVTVVSRKNISGHPDAHSDPHIRCPVVNLPEVMQTDPDTLLAAIDQGAEVAKG